jgi:hypothetical protein
MIDVIKMIFMREEGITPITLITSITVQAIAAIPVREGNRGRKTLVLCHA